MQLACKEGWLNEYMDYTKYSESPAIFHRWAGISVIATILGRNVYWDLGYQHIFPNLYVVLVARSAGLKKTAACEIGVDLLYNVPVSLKIIADKLTNEYMLKTLGLMNEREGKDAVAFVYAEELSVFIGPNALASGLISALTKLYNCPAYFPYGTKTSGSYMLVNCCLNMLGASTPEWLRLCMPGDSLGGGFAGRMTFVTAIDKERSIAHPKKIMPPKEQVMQQKKKLLEDLVTFSTLKGEYVLSDSASEWYHKWYKDRELEQQGDPRLESYYERKHALLMKVSMVMSVERGCEYVIDLQDILKAHEWINEVEKDMISAYEGITFSDSTRHLDRIIRQIKTSGSIGHSALLKKNHFHLNGEEFDKVVKTLLAAETIEEFVEGKKRYYRMRKGGEDE